MEGRGVILAGGAEGEEVLRQSAGAAQRGGGRAARTSAVLGTLSQKSSILRSPRSVCNCGARLADGGRGRASEKRTVTDMAAQGEWHPVGRSC